MGAPLEANGILLLLQEGVEKETPSYDDVESDKKEGDERKRGSSRVSKAPEENSRDASFSLALSLDGHGGTITWTCGMSGAAKLFPFPPFFLFFTRFRDRRPLDLALSARRPYP